MSLTWASTNGPMKCVLSFHYRIINKNLLIYYYYYYMCFTIFVQFSIFITWIYSYVFRGLSRGKIESVFGHFAKFNGVHVYVFYRAPHVPPIFLEVKNVPCPFLEIKSKPYPFSTISRARKPNSCRKMWIFEKYAVGKFLDWKTADFAPKHHFISRWRNIY